MPRGRRRKCHSCGQLYEPDPRNVYHQEYCARAECRAASKAISQRRWLRTPNGRAYFRGPANVRRVKNWRKTHPGYWRRRRKRSAALQDVLISQPLLPQGDTSKLNCSQLTAQPPLPSALSSTAQDFGRGKTFALQDVLFLESPAWLGLMSKLTGVALQDDIVAFTRRLILLGRQIQGQAVGVRRPADGSSQTSAVPGAVASHSTAIQLGGSSPGSG